MSLLTARKTPGEFFCTLPRADGTRKILGGPALIDLEFLEHVLKSPLYWIWENLGLPVAPWPPQLRRPCYLLKWIFWEICQLRVEKIRNKIRLWFKMCIMICKTTCSGKNILNRTGIFFTKIFLCNWEPCFCNLIESFEFFLILGIFENLSFWFLWVSWAP